jgi:hypothetical protein
MLRRHMYSTFEKNESIRDMKLINLETAMENIKKEHPNLSANRTNKIIIYTKMIFKCAKRKQYIKNDSSEDLRKNIS